MPVDVVKLDITTSTAALAKETYNDVAVIGRSNTEPAMGFSTPRRYNDSSAVADDTDDGSDSHVASETLEAMGVSDWIVTVLPENEYTETFGDDLEGDVVEVENTPISGSTNATVTVGSEELDAIPRTESPPTTEDGPNSGEAYINYDTGEVALGTLPAGDGDTVEVAYSAVQYTDGLAELRDLGVDVAFLANTHAGITDIGDLSQLASWGSGFYCAVVAAGENGANYDTQDAAMDAAHDVSAYLSSPNVLFVAHQSPDDVAAYVAGQLGVERPWHDPLFYGDSYPGLTNTPYRRALVGEPGQNGTFEGGNSDGEGSVNALISVQGTTVLSNSLTTAGLASNYRYLDVWRTEGFITDQAERALIGLALREDQIPFNTLGKTLIEDALKGSLFEYVGSRQPFTDLTVNVPGREQIPDDNVANRIWGPITINGTLSGNTHQFEVQFAASI